MTEVEMTILQYFVKKSKLASQISYELVPSISCMQNTSMYVKKSIYLQTQLMLRHVWKWHTIKIFSFQAIFTLSFLQKLVKKSKISSISDMCCDVTVHLHRNYPNHLSHKPFKGTLQCCGGNDGNTVGQLHFVYKIT